jgi:hypothetical protein
MASNIVVDATTISSLQSDLASLKQYLTTGQYYYSGRNSSNAIGLPLIPSDITNSISIFQATQAVVVSSNPSKTITFTPPNPFKNTPVVSAVVECSNPQGALIPVLLSITPGSYQMDFQIFTYGNTAALTNTTVYLHVTAICYE